jgi:hypothetical protein
MARSSLTVGGVGDSVVGDGVGNVGDGVVGDGVEDFGDGVVGDGVGVTARRLVKLLVAPEA